MAWTAAIDLSTLAAKGRAVARVGGRQIALFHVEGRIHACNNRCPHEGYPLIDGGLADGRVLTCNWHNWKFDLESGETLVGGDRLRRYDTRIVDGKVEIDLVEPPLAERRAAILQGFAQALEDNNYEHLAREIARLDHIGADPLDAVRAAIIWAHDRLEFGWTHAFAVTADWLALYADQRRDAAERLVARAEIAGYIADDAQRAERYPFAEGERPFDGEALVAAIEAEDENAAVALVRGACRTPQLPADLMPALARAALTHYQDFGHALIYVTKAETLIAALGREVAEPLLLSLVRGLVYATREDLLPEFRDYADKLASWGKVGDDAKLESASLRGLNARHAMARVAGWGGRHEPAAIYAMLLEALAWNMLHFDLSFDTRTEGPIGDNINWLDFTHGVTFANAVRKTCAHVPALWPAGLLQLACFVGRNVGYVDAALDEAPWRVSDPAAFLDRAIAGLFDHGRERFIVAAHLVKTLLAARQEGAAVPVAAPTVLAAANRLLHSPLKGRHRLRTAKQTLAFVAED
ncbi:MAG: Rieske (2Fe-2S) protein [Proteobacteria bacterium]|nr:Rieske (2Fe-2S) protein [Pseudomonadota bacterium]